MANEYITSEQLKATFEITGANADDEAAIAVESASRAIDKACSLDKSYPRRFWLDEADTSRFYTPWDPDLLVVHDVVEVTTLQTDADGDGTFEQVWTENTDFVLEPFNAEVEGKPYTLVRRLPRGRFRFPTCYPRSVELVGKFGWLAVPPEIRSATSLVAGRLFKRSRGAAILGVVSLGVEAAGRIARNDDDVQRLIHDYKRGTGLL
jgi:hypothetical protein